MNKLAILLLLVSSLVSAQVPNISAKSYVVLDEAGQIILAHDEDTIRPIASISKLLVAEQIVPVLLAGNSVLVKKEDSANMRAHIKTNTMLTEQQLLELALIPSNNQAIYALAREHGTDFIIKKVNQAAMDRGLYSIYLEEPSGLSMMNHASAKDLALFANMISEPLLNIITTTEETSYGHYKSTNPLLHKPGWDFILSKTGFINASGGCLVVILNINNQRDTVVILDSANTHTRWDDLIKIRNYLAPSDIFWQFAKTKILKKKSRNK